MIAFYNGGLTQLKSRWLFGLLDTMKHDTEVYRELIKAKISGDYLATGRPYVH